MIGLLHIIQLEIWSLRHGINDLTHKGKSELIMGTRYFLYYTDMLQNMTYRNIMVIIILNVSLYTGSSHTENPSDLD